MRFSVLRQEYFVNELISSCNSSENDADLIFIQGEQAFQQLRTHAW